MWHDKWWLMDAETGGDAAGGTGGSAGTADAGGGDDDSGGDDFDLGAAMDSVARELAAPDKGSGGPAISSTSDGDTLEGKKPTSPQTPKPGEEGKVEGDKTPTTRPLPKSWKADYEEQWSKLDPKVQEYVEQREQEYTAGITQHKNGYEYGKSIWDAFNEHKDVLARSGVTDHVATVKAMLGTHVALSTSDPVRKAEIFSALAQHYGVNLGQVNEAPARDEYTKSLEARLSKLEGGWSEAEKAQRRAQEQQLDAQIQKFAADPKNEHFAALADDITKLINVGYSLEDAYERAVWANPVTREKVQAKQLAADQEALRKAAEEEAKGSEKARGTIVHGRESDKSPTEKLGTMDETFAETLAAIKRREARKT